MNIEKLKEIYVGKEYVTVTDTKRNVLVIDIDELFMTVKVTENRYARVNCVGNYFPYVNDVIKYPLTNLPEMYILGKD